ncbi:Uncharacterised protein [Bordetella pertussis]|nr:Uncharacterised protein [Bordetella pertussis]
MLPGAGHAAPAVPARAGQVQGLHRHPQGQRLPVLAHHAGGSVWHAGGVPVPHARHAPHRRGRRGLALALQGCRPDAQRAAEAHPPVAAVATRHPEPDRRFGRVPRTRQGRPVPRRDLCLHPARQDHFPAARRHAGRFRLRHPYRHRQPGGRRQGQWRVRPAAHRAQQRRHGRNHHFAGLAPERAMAQLRAHRPRPFRNPPLPANRQVRGVRGLRRATA